MGWSDLWLRLRALASRRRAEQDLDDELSFHLEMEARKGLAAGAPQDEARRAARVNFGGVDKAREECRDARGLTALENLARDFRYAFRVLRRSPAFTGAAVVSLAIGIGATTAIFSLVDAVLLKTLPVRNPRELVVAKWEAKYTSDLNFTWRAGGGNRANVFSWQAFQDFRSRSRTLTSIFGFAPLGRVNAATHGEARMAGALLVSGNYFPALGVNTLLGRPILADDDSAGGVPAAVISYRFWKSAFDQDPSVLGRTLYVNRHPCVVVGVTPRDFFGVSLGGFSIVRDVDITLPILAVERLQAASGHPMRWFDRESFWIQAMGRVRKADDIPAARAELAGILAADLPPSRNAEARAPRVDLEPGSQGIGRARESLHDPLLILFGVAGLTLLMACANLAGLLLARSASRTREICLRLSLGAGRARVMGQLLCEGALIAAGGAAAGLLLAWWGVRALLAAVASGPNALILDVVPDVRIMAFAAGVSVAAILLFGLAPALRATRVDLSQGMKKGAGRSRGAGRFGAVRALVTAQVAVALLLASGASLLTRSLIELRGLPLGFDPGNVVVFGVSPGSNGYDEARGNEFYRRLTEKLGALPGVTGATLSLSSPISGWMSNSRFRLDDDASRQPYGSTVNFVGPDFLAVLRIPVVAGRGIELRDLESAQRVAVINEAAARAAFGAGSPIGRRIRWTSKPEWDYTVIGVAKDAKYNKIQGEFPSTVYIPYTQNTFGWRGDMQVEVRTAGRPAAALPAIRAAVRELDRMLPVVEPKSLETQIGESILQQRLLAFLVSLFGTVTLGLACVGIYGLVSCSVASRTQEIGIRVALGADRMDVLRALLAQVCVITAIGLAVGVPATLALKKIIGSLVFGIEPDDPASLAFACIAVAAVSLLAAYAPARRAARIDPVRALRYE